jgi:MoxR-like ATPase
LWVIYTVTIAQFILSALFEPGQTAILPSLLQPEDIVEGNTLFSITWSVMLAAARNWIDYEGTDVDRFLSEIASYSKPPEKCAERQASDAAKKAAEERARAEKESRKKADQERKAQEEAAKRQAKSSRR